MCADDASTAPEFHIHLQLDENETRTQKEKKKTKRRKRRRKRRRRDETAASIFGGILLAANEKRVGPMLRSASAR